MRTDALNNVQSILGEARRRRPRLMTVLISALTAAAITIPTMAYFHSRSVPLSGAQIIAIRVMASQAGQAQSVPQSRVWQRFYDRYDVDSPLELRNGDFASSVEFLATMIEQGRR